MIMMWRLVLAVVVFASSVCLYTCQNVSITEDEFTSMLHDAMADVLAQQSDVTARRSSPPFFRMNDNFMHSFLPKTGVGNREELIIEELLPLPVFGEDSFSKFLFKHYNNTDYVAGISDNYLVLTKINKTLNGYFALTREDAVLTFYVESVFVRDVVLFTRIVDNSEVFSVAVLTENVKTAVVYIYEVLGDSAMMVSSIELNIDLTSSSVKKIAYVQSSHGGSLVVLTSAAETKLVYHQRGHNKQNHYIEVQYPSPVDFTTFTVQGHGYIAVASAEFCDIFKMDQFVGSHIQFDRLGPLNGIVDLEYFRLGFHHFLAVADQNEQHLYTWKRGEFALKQRIAIPYTERIYALTVESCRDEVLLLTVLHYGQFRLHVFKGETEEFESVGVEIPENYLIVPSSVASFTSHNTVVVLSNNFDGQSQALVIKTSLKSLRDPFLIEGERISKVMKNIQDTIKSQNREIKRLKDMLKNAIRGTGTQYITGFQNFNEISATLEIEVEKVNEFLVGWEDSSLTLEEYRQGTEDLEKNVESLESLVVEIERQIPDIVRLDEDTVQKITGQKIFLGYVSAENLITETINLHKVAGIDLPQLQKDVYRLDKPQVIDGTLTFNEALTVIGNFDIQTTVNGIDISEEVMTTNTEQKSYAPMVFVNSFVVRGNLDVTGKINDIDFGKEVVTLDGTHHISGHKNFLNGITAEKVETRLLDGIDIEDLYRRAFTKSGSQTIDGDSTFSTITTNDIILKGKLNGYDVQEIQKNIVRTDRPALIDGYKMFSNDVIIDGELTVHGTVNGLRIPDDLVLTDTSKTITGTKEFVGQVTAANVNVLGKIDGLSIPEDIVTLSKEEEIASTLYFADGIVAEKDIIVEGLVDGIDVSEIAKQALTLNESHTFTKAAFSGPVTITGDLNVRGLVNKVDLNKLLQDIVFRDEKSIEILSEKNFKQIRADKINLERAINGFNISVDFMKIRGHQTITGTKTFKNALFGPIQIEDGMIDGLNINDLYQQRLKLSIEEDSVVNEEIEFVDLVEVGDLTIHGTINGINLQDVLWRSSPQPISNKHFSNRVKVDNLIIDGDINVRNFAGVDLTQFYHDRVTLSGDQDIDGDLFLGNTVASKVSISGLVNDMDIVDFAKNVMLKSKPNQVVTAVKEFTGNVSVLGDIYTSEGVNGFKLSEVNQRAFKLEEDNIVWAALEFENNITINDLIVEDINGVNMQRLIEDSLKKNGLQHVTGESVFQAGFDVVGDIVATKVNDLILTEDVLLKTIPQTIKGQFTFKSMNIDGDLYVKGLINGLNLTEVVPKLAKINEEETVVESNVTFTGSLSVLEDIEVTGLVNEVDLKELFDKVLRKTGNQNITGHKTFRGNVTVIRDIDAKYVNGINWKAFLDDVVWINTPQVIHSPKAFSQDIYAKDVHVSGLANVGLINGKDLQRFVREAVFIDQPANITGPIIFKDTVTIVGNMTADLINGLSLKNDVITIKCSDDGPQVISGQKSFQNLHVYGDIYSNAVNSYDLSALYDDTLLTEGNQTIHGSKSIQGDVVFTKDVYPDMVNGMMLNRDLVTLDTTQKIEGPLTFQEDVFVKKDLFINGSLNGVDLQTLSREAVYLKTDQVIEGEYTIENAVAQSDVEVAGTVNDIDLPVFDKNVTEFLKDMKQSLALMDGYAADQCELAKYIQDSLKETYFVLDNFILHQYLESPATFVEVRSENSITLAHLDDYATAAVAVESTWNEQTQRFVSNYSAKTLIARSVSYRIGSVAFTVNTGINSRDSTIVVKTSASSVIQSGFAQSSVLIKGNQAIIALLFPDKSSCDIYMLKEDPEKVYSFELDGTPLLIVKESTSVVIFEVSNIPHLAISSSRFPYSSGSAIYAKNKKWKLIQHIPASGSFVKYFDYHNYHYLAFVNEAPPYETKEPKSIQIYRNSAQRDSEFGLFQKVAFDDARGLEVFQFGDSLQLHLVTWNETRIQVFSFQGESGMKELLTLYGSCIRDVKPLLKGDDVFLIVGQQNLKMGNSVTSHLYKSITKGIKFKPYQLEYC